MGEFCHSLSSHVTKEASVQHGANHDGKGIGQRITAENCGVFNQFIRYDLTFRFPFSIGRS